MKLEIFISSAVELEEKQSVKNKLENMRDKLHLIDFDKLYDCAEHGTTWAIDSKQDIINNMIPHMDWFICLIPEQTVGEATWKELKLILEVHKKGAPVVISVFHPMKFPKQKKMLKSLKEESHLTTSCNKQKRFLGIMSINIG